MQSFPSRIVARDELRLVLRSATLVHPNIVGATNVVTFIASTLRSWRRWDLNDGRLAAFALFEAAMQRGETAVSERGVSWYPLVAARHLFGLVDYDLTNANAPIAGSAVTLTDVARAFERELKREYSAARLDPLAPNSWTFRQILAALATDLGNTRGVFSPSKQNIRAVADELWEAVRDLLEAVDRESVARSIELWQHRSDEAISVREEPCEQSDQGAIASPVDTMSNGNGSVGALEVRTRRRFVGREDELAALSAATLRGPVLLTGPPGSGKTALATHWAEVSRELFTDGTFRVDLRGFSGEPALSTLEIHTRILELVTGQRHNSENESIDVLLASTIRGRNCLIILDNVVTFSQVRFVMDCADSATIVLASRVAMAEAIGAGAESIKLGRIGDREARTILEYYVGRDRLGSDPDAVSRILTICDGLPLLLSIVGARLKLLPQRRLSAVAAQFSDADALLDIAWSGEAPYVGQVIRWSFDQLNPADQRLLVRLASAPKSALSPVLGVFLSLVDESEEADEPYIVDGLLPTREFSLSRSVYRSALRSIDNLILANMIDEVEEGALEMIDLVRTFGRTQASERLRLAVGLASFDYLVEMSGVTSTVPIGQPTTVKPQSPSGSKPLSTAEVNSALQSVMWRADKTAPNVDTLRGAILTAGHALSSQSWPAALASLKIAWRQFDALGAERIEAHFEPALLAVGDQLAALIQQYTFKADWSPLTRRLWSDLQRVREERGENHFGVSVAEFMFSWMNMMPDGELRAAEAHCRREFILDFSFLSDTPKPDLKIFEHLSVETLPDLMNLGIAEGFARLGLLSDEPTISDHWFGIIGKVFTIDNPDRWPADGVIPALIRWVRDLVSRGELDQALTVARGLREYATQFSLLAARNDLDEIVEVLGS